MRAPIVMLLLSMAFVGCGDDDDGDRSAPGEGEICNGIDGCRSGLRCLRGVCTRLESDMAIADVGDLGGDMPPAPPAPPPGDMGPVPPGPPADMGPNRAELGPADAGPDGDPGDMGPMPIDLGPSDMGPSPCGPAMCSVAGTCYADGASNPANRCDVCDARAPFGWSARACDDGVACTADTCDPARGCVAPLVAGSCMIASTCYLAGAGPPGDPCIVCDPTMSPYSWSSSPTGTPCDRGASCTTGDECVRGSCDFGPVIAGACLIDAICRADGESDPADMCRTCDASLDQLAWTVEMGCF